MFASISVDAVLAAMQTAGLPDHVIDLFPAAAVIGLEMQPLKCGSVVVQSGEDREAVFELDGMVLQQKLLVKGIDVLAVSLTTPEAVEHLDEILTFAEKALDRELVYVQDGLLLLQHRVLTKATHILWYSSIHGEILKEFDAQLCAKEIDRFGLDADTDPRWLHLPLRCGGFGLFLLAELQPAAIIGAVAGFLASAELFVRP